MAEIRNCKKRGKKYDGIILDPPAFGHGANKEVWKIEDDLLPFLKLCREAMTDTPLFFLVNGYASGYSPIAYENNLKDQTNLNGELSNFKNIFILDSSILPDMPAHPTTFNVCINAARIVENLKNSEVI